MCRRLFHKYMPEAVVDEQAAANMTLVDSGLLLGAFAPAEPWVERGVGYRQWRLLKGEANSEQSKGASSSSSSMTEVRSDLNANDFDVDHVLGDGNYSQVFQATLRSWLDAAQGRAHDDRQVQVRGRDECVWRSMWCVVCTATPAVP